MSTPKKQLMPVDRYVDLVRNAGIEQAYQMRHRGTGRTKRLVLRTLALISEGEHVIMRYGYAEHSRDVPPYSYQRAKDFMRQVRELANMYMHDIEWQFRESSMDCITSGGKFVLVNEATDHRGTWQKLRTEAIEVKEDME